VLLALAEPSKPCLLPPSGPSGPGPLTEPCRGLPAEWTEWTGPPYRALQGTPCPGGAVRALEGVHALLPVLEGVDSLSGSPGPLPPVPEGLDSL
jgi:hypothetical protein